MTVSRLTIVSIAMTMAACNAKMGKKGGTQPNPLPPPIEQQQSYYPPGYVTTPGSNVPVAPIVGHYPTNQFDPHVALNGLGEWIVIDGQRFWVPNLGQVQDREGWSPYQQGFWSYDQDRDWTWNSEEPWGAITDHYGVWRHHRNRGWIWMAFPDNRYEPHCVTWFDEGEYFGWYPYLPGFDAHYRRFNQSHGFDDGFWNGHQAVLALNGSGFSFRIGITMVPRVEITQRNIRRYMVRDPHRIAQIARAAHSDRHFRSGRVGRIPGGDRRGSHDYVQRWAHHRPPAPIGRAREVVGPRGARIMQPHFERRDDRRRDDSRGSRDSGVRQIPTTVVGAPPVTPAPAAPAVTPRPQDRQDRRTRDERRRDDSRENRDSGGRQITTPVVTQPAAPAPAAPAPAAPAATARPQDRRTNDRTGDRSDGRDDRRGRRGTDRSVDTPVTTDVTTPPASN